MPNHSRPAATRDYRSILTSFAAGAIVTALLTIGVQSIASQHTRQTDTNPYREIPPDVIEMIEAAEIAFMNQDADGVRQHLAEDFTWYQVGPEGAKQTVSGREETVQLLSSFFGSDSWIESEVHRLGMLGNILVQVEVDTFMREGTPVQMETLSVYEFRDGKRWREWKFYPAEKNP